MTPMDDSSDDKQLFHKSEEAIQPEKTIAAHYDSHPFYVRADEIVLEGILKTTVLGDFVRQQDFSQFLHFIDVGCGGFAKNISFLRRFVLNDQQSMVGTDISLQSLALAQQQHPRANFFQANTERLPFKDNTFDFATATGTLVCMDQPDRGLQEILRIVKPGRYVYLSLYNKENIYYPVYRAAKFLRVLKKRGFEPLIQYFFVPCYAMVYWLANIVFAKKLRRISYREIQMDFYDKFMIPVAKFWNREEAYSLVGDRGQILACKPHYWGMMLGMLIQKKKS